MRQNAVKGVLQQTGMNNSELAEFFGVSRQTVHRWITQNSIPEKYRNKLMDVPGKTFKVVEKNGRVVDLELINNESFVEELNESKEAKDERKGIIASLTTEELVTELTERGWKVSLAKIPEGENGEDRK